MYSVTPPSRPLIKVLNNVAASTNPCSTLLFTLHHLQDHSHPSCAPFITSKQILQTKAVLFELHCWLWVRTKRKKCQVAVAGRGGTRAGWWYHSNLLLTDEARWTGREKRNPSLHPSVPCSRVFPDALWSGTRDHILEEGTINYPNGCSTSQHTTGITVTSWREIPFIST